MPLVNWSHELEVGSAEMDAQHRKLIAIINEFYEAVERKAPRAELQQIFAKVADFATYHFRDEEALMERAGFPHLARHRIIHQQLVAQVATMMSGLGEGRTGIEEEIRYFLKSWLTAHIIGIDRQYRPYVSAPPPT